MNLRRTLREQRQENATRAVQSERTARLSLRELQSENQNLLEENLNLQDELRKQRSAVHALTEELRKARWRNRELLEMNGSLLKLLSPEQEAAIRELANIRLEIKRLQSGEEGKPSASNRKPKCSAESATPSR